LLINKILFGFRHFTILDLDERYERFNKKKER